jgi:hypothetical protein
MTAEAPTDAAPTLLVVLDHHEAKVYRTETRASVPERIVPYDPHGHGRHLHSAHEWTDGKRVPERKSYYEAIAKTRAGAGRVVLFGSGTGRSSAMDQLMADLTEHHPDVAAKVVAAVVVDAHHTTEPQLLAQARAIFADDRTKA